MWVPKGGYPGSRGVTPDTQTIFFFLNIWDFVSAVGNFFSSVLQFFWFLGPFFEGLFLSPQI